MLSSEQNSKNSYQDFHFKQNSLSLSFFGFLPITKNTWIASNITLGKSTLPEIRRTSYLEHTNFLESSHTKSKQLSANLHLGYNFQLQENVLLVPTITYSYSRIKINDHTENNTIYNSGSMQFKDIKQSQNIISAGLTLSTQNQPINFYSTLKYNHIMSGDKVNIQSKLNQAQNYRSTEEKLSDKNSIELSLGSSIKLNSKVTNYYNFNIAKSKSEKARPSFAIGIKLNL